MCLKKRNFFSHVGSMHEEEAKYPNVLAYVWSLHVSRSSSSTGMLLFLQRGLQITKTDVKQAIPDQQLRALILIRAVEVGKMLVERGNSETVSQMAFSYSYPSPPKELLRPLWEKSRYCTIGLLWP